MRFLTRLRPGRLALEDSFYCRPRRVVVVLGQCLDRYLDANSFERKGSVCFRCPAGRANREEYADAGDPDA